MNTYLEERLVFKALFCLPKILKKKFILHYKPECKIMLKLIEAFSEKVEIKISYKRHVTGIRHRFDSP